MAFTRRLKQRDQRYDYLVSYGVEKRKAYFISRNPFMSARRFVEGIQKKSAKQRRNISPGT